MVREASVTLAQGPARYLEAGAGRPCVLLHAFPLGAEMWRPQLERVPAGTRLIAPDLRGFGPAPGSPAQSIDDMADGVLALIDALRLERPAIGGLSMGGYVTFAVLRRAIDRFDSVILADTRATADTAQGRAGRARMLDTLHAGGVRAVADEMMPKLLGDTSRRDRPEVEHRVRSIIAANTPDGVAGAVAAMRDRPDSTGSLTSLALPTLVVAGEEDTLTPPSDAEAIASNVSGSTLTILPKAGHLSNMEAPGPFCEALFSFLASHP